MCLVKTFQAKTLIFLFLDKRLEKEKKYNIWVCIRSTEVELQVGGVCMLHCLGISLPSNSCSLYASLSWLAGTLNGPSQLGPSFLAQGPFLASPRTRHTRSPGWKAHGWTFVLYLLAAWSLVASSLILTMSWTSSVVSSSTFVFSSFCCCWNIGLLVDGSPTSTVIMVSMPYVSR